MASDPFRAFVSRSLFVPSHKLSISLVYVASISSMRRGGEAATSQNMVITASIGLPSTTWIAEQKHTAGQRSAALMKEQLLTGEEPS